MAKGHPPCFQQSRHLIRQLSNTHARSQHTEKHNFIIIIKDMEDALSMIPNKTPLGRFFQRKEQGFEN